MFKKIAIIGVGLIGGSIGLALRSKKLAGQIIGVCRHSQSLRKAVQIGAIDKGSLNCQQAVKGADLVILAAPISQIIKIGKKIAPYLKRGCLLTDVGSTKEELVSEIEKVIPEGIYFVGAHPLAGSEKRGAAFARADLFKDALCLLTKSRKTDPSALKNLSRFWRILGCTVKVTTPAQHDKIVAAVSHLPHLAAVELVCAAEGNLDFAASGFRDTTRIASSDSESWTDVFLSNAGYTLEALEVYIKRLKSIGRLISGRNRTKLKAEFKRAKAIRDALQR
jgi:prephenate dehydrogenase